MPRITAATNVEQRENTRQAILRSFGELLFERGLPNLTITDVSKHSGIGRTAIYNYFGDIEELLVNYALEETERFVVNLRQKIEYVENPVDRLGIYVAAQIEDLSNRHLPPGPAMRTLLSRESYDRLADHVGGLTTLLEEILADAVAQSYLLPFDIQEASALVHGSLAASVHCNGDETPVEHQKHVERSVRFIQRGLGACFCCVDGRETPVRIRGER